jgi:hypothetical protein
MDTNKHESEGSVGCSPLRCSRASGDRGLSRDYSAANRSQQREQRDGRGRRQGFPHARSLHRIVTSLRPFPAPTSRRQSSLFSLLSPVPSASFRLRACLKNVWLPRARPRPSSIVLGFAGHFEDEDEGRGRGRDANRMFRHVLKWPEGRAPVEIGFLRVPSRSFAVQAPCF